MSETQYPVAKVTRRTGAALAILLATASASPPTAAVSVPTTARGVGGNRCCGCFISAASGDGERRSAHQAADARSRPLSNPAKSTRPKGNFSRFSHSTINNRRLRAATTAHEELQQKQDGSGPLSDVTEMIDRGMNGRFMFYASATTDESDPSPDSSPAFSHRHPESESVGLGPANPSPTPSATPSMPAWLQGAPLTPLALQSKLSSIRSSMSSRSHLSNAEIRSVTSALTSSAPTVPRLSGVLEFTSILVEHMEMGRDALIAAAFHYSSCVTVRELEAQRINGADGVGRRDRLDGIFHHPPEEPASARQPEPLPGAAVDLDTAYLCPLAGSGIERYGAQAVRIALDAARLKGTEAVADAISSDGSTRNTSRPSRDDFENLRSLLLSVNASGDWRALAIRAAACLYRLRGLEAHRSRHHPDLPHPTEDEVRVGRQALHIYGPLAHRLGMYRLKSELECAAFRVLYRRQYEAVMALLYHRRDGGKTTRRGIPLVAKVTNLSTDDEGSVEDGMKSVLADITSRVKRLLHEDDTLMEHVSNIAVTARVKEPYSLWRKIVRIRTSNRQLGDVNRVLSVLDVPDAVALRVVLSARKLSPDEDDDVTSARERALCYYVHQLCTSHLPNTPSDFFSPGEGNGNRFKDYIQHPKPNGYQSLHYSARARWHGEYWPFEVQIRTADMHRVAEYGMAAHWEFKNKGKDRVGVGSCSSYLDGLDCHGANTPGSRRQPQDHHGRPLSSGSVETMGFSSLASTDSLDRSYEESMKTKLNRERAERLAPYIEALSTARTDLVREKVFVFLNMPVSIQGSGMSLSILSLPAGARVVEALRAQERRSNQDLKLFRRPGRKLVGADEKAVVILRNGVLSSMTQRLESGDVLTLCLPSTDEEEVDHRVGANNAGP